MSKLVVIAVVVGLSSLGMAGCSHFHQRADAYTPVVETPPPAQQPVYSGKWR